METEYVRKKREEKRQREREGVRQVWEQGGKGREYEIEREGGREREKFGEKGR